jgi:GDP-4-dehydro-6-deoxy-D-mannose reductase
MTTALITGINGFVGQHLTTLLRLKGYTVTGIGIEPLSSIPDIAYEMVDITDSNSVAQIVERMCPQEIYHLAAVSFPAEASRSPRSALDINITGTISVIDAMKRFCHKSKLLIVGSSLEYDCTFDGLVSEDAEPKPSNFYGVSKYATELIGKQYCREYNLDIRFTRSFNHTGPGQLPLFVCSDWSKQIALMECGKTEPVLHVGDCGPEIDFTDVRDVVNAYVAIMEKGKSGQVYNVASGKTIPLQWILDYLVKKSSKKIAIIRDEKKIRDVKAYRKLSGDNSKLRRETGWTTTFSFDKTLDDLFTYWIHKVQTENLI